MTTYAPGTVAMVTYDGERGKAFLDVEGNWTFADENLTVACKHEAVSDITPLVCIEATLEDARAFEVAASALNENGYRGPAARCQKVAAAIREQAPAPEPPKRWMVIGSFPDNWWWLQDNGVRTDVRGSEHQSVKAIADALNGAVAS